MLYLCFSENYLNLSRDFHFWKEGWGGRTKALKKICRPRAIFYGFDPPWQRRMELHALTRGPWNFILFYGRRFTSCLLLFPPSHG